MICPICGKEACEERELYSEGSYYQRCATIGCERCGLYLYSDTLRKARNKWKKLVNNVIRKV